MRHGVVILPDEPWRKGAYRWEEAERLGFDHAWTFDHLMWREMRNSSWFPAMPTLTAASMVTSRLKLGTLVATPNLHHPVTLAKEMIALDDISGGRALFGLGAGAVGHDSRAMGDDDMSACARANRFCDFVAIIHALMTQQETNIVGEYYKARDVHIAHGLSGDGPPQLAVAAGGRRTMLAAARYGQAWVTLGEPGRSEESRFDQGCKRLHNQVDLFDQACDLEGRDPESISRIVVAGKQLGGVLDSIDSFEEAEGLFGELGFTDMLVFWPRISPPFEGKFAVLEEIASLWLD